MAPRISLALAIHNHQPVGNFGWVIDEVYRTAYEPLVAALERHSRVRLALHYTGPLLEWLESEQPDFLERLDRLVGRRQVELMGGGHFEPVLASLPERDRVGQLRLMADEVERLFGRRPRGAWLAERVWEPSLPVAVVDAGYGWTIVDDNHFRAASIPDDAHWGAYTTDDQGRRLTVFGTEQGLRYLIPFRSVEETIAHLRAHATEDGRRLGTMGDDGEKFGAWPTTWDHCWGESAWMDRFFDALEANADWLTTTTPSDWLLHERPIGRVYLPTASYVEMTGWALPADESQAFAEAVDAAREESRPEAKWLRGGFWRNFQVKYREVNDLHKQMLRASDKVDRMPASADRLRALDHLYRGQSNDCYWHGLFGGIYIGHMRQATFEHLIAAEDLADAAARATGEPIDGVALADIDLDGVEEVIATSPGQLITVKLDEGAGISSWDIRAVWHAMGGVLRRRPESYHHLLVEHDARQAIEARAAAAVGASGATEVESIHAIVRSKEPGLAARLHYDAYERRAGLVHFMPLDTSPETFATARFSELGDFVSEPWSLVERGYGGFTAARDGHVHRAGRTIPVRVEKQLRLGGDRRAPWLELDLTVRNLGDERLAALLAVEWPTYLAGGGGNPDAYHEIRGHRSPHDGTGSTTAVGTLASGNDHVGLRLTTVVQPAAAAWWSPIETISNSEAGFERVYQGSCLVLSWPISLAAGERVDVVIRQRVRTDRDRAEDERLG